eukprot:TRINITY_DN4335_c0_g1_i6.p1 TRINITY_DN4335_c0_g1~~TRINITY_DN4335_c0_g1_i6.p1  ORF type:complete len:154 (-),score=20.13 TRINITY_DN4335_c0_g1_i6:67-501(-)
MSSRGRSPCVTLALTSVAAALSMLTRSSPLLTAWRDELPILDSVVAGAHHRILEGGHQKRSIASMEFNADWNNPAFNNDVALITVSEPFDFTDPNVQPIEMFKGSDAEIPPRDNLQQHWMGLHLRSWTLPPQCSSVGSASSTLS